MKKILYILLFFPFFAIGQDTNQNFTKKITYKQPVTSSVANPDLETAVIEVTYFDGLGRPIQKIANGQSNTGKDIVTHFEYDAFGRQTKEFLPYVNGTASLNYNPNAGTDVLNYYVTPEYDYTVNPYSEKLLETSPLSRVLKQAAPGDSWAMDSGHEIKMDYQTNTETEVKRFKATATWNTTLALYEIGITNPGDYAPEQLYKTITKDENWISGNNNTTQEFKNKEGQVVLKRTFNIIAHDTYYVYDQFGNLTYVLPPLAEGSITPGVLNGLCYQYKYDYRNRMVAKKLPGKQWEFIVYNRLDMPVATGPALSPFGDGTYGWLITKHEPFGRVAFTGWYPGIAADENGRAAFQTSQNSSPGMFEMRLNDYNSTVDAVAINYSDKSVFPMSGYKLLTVNYYDDYLYPDAPTPPSTLPDSTYPLADYTKGLATGSWVRVLTIPEETLAETSYTLYDSKFRPVRTHTTNHLGGYTEVDSKIDFAGKTEYTFTRHKRLDSDNEIVVKDMFTYSDQDRLVLHKHQINGMDEQLIAGNTYDELGQLISKNVGGTDTSGSVGLQKVDYKYNIRGWLKSINDIYELNQSSDPLDLFAFKISYQDNDIMSHNTYIVPQLYNGNISETFWKTSADNVLRKYGYKYDKLNRLTRATYQKPGSSDFLTSSYDEILSYDKNGNIQQLTRNGEYDDDTYVLTIDELTYSYDPDSPNQLKKVFDSTNNPKGFNDDSDGITDDVDDYAYDANGNMTQDGNKGIKSITYNHLNLPTLIDFNPSKINYIYNALGQKVQKATHEKVEGVVEIKVTDYLAGGFQYKEGILLFFPHAEGYVNFVDGGKSIDYVFNYTDHLGNVRVSYGVDPTTGELKTLEESNYYPFGLKHANYNIDQRTYYGDGLDNLVLGLCETCPKEYKYKYQGQERQDELGLNWDSFKWRNYDYAIGRFMSIDPLAESYTYNSPYAFQENKMGLGRELEGLEMTSDRSKDGKSVTITIRANFTNSTTSSYAVPDFKAAKNEIMADTRANLSGKMSDGTNVSVSFIEDPKATINYNFVDMIPDNGSGIPPDGLTTIGNTQNNTVSISSEGHYYTKNDPNNPNQERPDVGRTGAHETGHMMGLKHIDDDSNPKNVVDGMYNNQDSSVTKVNGQNKVTTVGNLMESGKIVNKNQRDIMVNTIEKQQNK